jgi:hypothetical protein
MIKYALLFYLISHYACKKFDFYSLKFGMSPILCRGRCMTLSLLLLQINHRVQSIIIFRGGQVRTFSSTSTSTGVSRPEYFFLKQCWKKSDCCSKIWHICMSNFSPHMLLRMTHILSVYMISWVEYWDQ